MVFNIIPLIVPVHFILEEAYIIPELSKLKFIFVNRPLVDLVSLKLIKELLIFPWVAALSFKLTFVSSSSAKSLSL